MRNFVRTYKVSILNKINSIKIFRQMEKYSRWLESTTFPQLWKAYDFAECVKKCRHCPHFPPFHGNPKHANLALWSGEGAELLFSIPLTRA